MATRIFLIGFMGSGKSSIGKKLAALFHFDFFDTDAEIERITGKTALQIFETDGENVFREKERTVIAELSQKTNIVVATGGGTPCFFDNMQRMNQTGLTIYLQASPKMLKQRITKQKQQRPLLKNIPDEQLEPYITQLLHQREPYYRQSQITVEALNLSAKKLMRVIREKYPVIV
jgi:shikimate kinase